MLSSMNFFTLFLLFSFAFYVSARYDVRNDDRISRYLKKLEDTKYDKRIAPIREDGSPVKVRVSSYILDIHKVDDLNMDLYADFFFRQLWHDPRLAHSEEKDVITLRDEDPIWTPDLFFVEEREGRIHQVVQPNKFVSIKPDGEVLFSVKVSVRFSCPMDLRRYPHDIQKCTLTIESYGYKRSHIDLEWKSSKIDYEPLSASENITLLDFDLIDVKPTSRNVSFTFGEYSCLRINLTFKRKFGFFATRLYVPFIILVVLSMFSFRIKPEERVLRLSLLLVILYLMVTISTDVNSFTPPAPYTKATDVWIGFCESLVFAVFLEFIIVALITKKDSENADAKGEILATLDLDSKESNLSTDSLKSPMAKLINMFDARYGGKGKKNRKAYRIDKISKILTPFIFILFNVVYWGVYATI